MFLFVCVVAVIGYMAHGWKIDDAIYMVVITIFGVGYGEVQPVESTGLRALTILVIISGYGAVIYTVGGCMQMLIDGELNKALGARRMTKGIERLEGHTIICGVGRLGTILARELAKAGKQFVVIDMDAARLQDAEARGYLVLQGDASEEEVLEAAGIRRAAVVATVLSQDASNVFVTITARGMNPDVTIIARGENPRTEKKLLGSGANQVVLPTAIGAEKVAQLITRPAAEGMLDELRSTSVMVDNLGHIGLSFDELIVQPGSPMVDRPLREIEIKSNHGFLIVGIRAAAGGGKSELNPDPKTVLRVHDVVIVLGHKDDLPELASKFTAKAKKMTYRGVTVES